MDTNLQDEIEVIYNEFREKYKYKLPGRCADLMLFYRELVEECLEGYSSTIYEWDDELVWRDYIKDFLAYLLHKNNYLHDNLSSMVHSIDLQLKSVFLDNFSRRVTREEEGWWYLGVLKKAGLPYATNVKRIYSLKIKTVG